MMVVFMGPDGSGKSSVIKLLAQQLSNQFDLIQCCHLKLPISQKVPYGSAPPVIAPHDQSLYNPVLSIIKVLYFVMIYNAGFVINYHKLTSSKKLLILDRYYHDLLVDPKRFRYGGSPMVSKIGGMFIPQPDLWFFLDAPAKVLQSRKQEVPFQETERQCLAYRMLAQELPNSVLVDATQPLSEIVADIKKQILQHPCLKT